MLRRTGLEASFFLTTIECCSGQKFSVSTSSKLLYLGEVNTCRDADSREIQTLSTDETPSSGLSKTVYG
jgi:hypothetical protein